MSGEGEGEGSDKVTEREGGLLLTACLFTL